MGEIAQDGWSVRSDEASREVTCVAGELAGVVNAGPQFAVEIGIANEDP